MEKVIKNLPFETMNYSNLSSKKLFKIFRTFYRRNKLYEAIGILKKLEKMDFRKIRVKFLIALCYDKLAYLTKETEYEDAAKKAYEELLEMKMSLRQKKEIKNEYNRFMNRLYELNESEYRAVIKAQSLGGREIKTAKSWFVLGTNFNIRKNVDFVINAYKKAIEIEPNYILALFRLAYIYQYNKKEELLAMKYYVKLVKLQPEQDTNESETVNAKCILDGCCKLASIYYKKNEYRKIIALFNQALKIREQYLPEQALFSIKSLIYLADLSAAQINMKETLDAYLRDNYYTTLRHLRTKYCREVSVA